MSIEQSQAQTQGRPATVASGVPEAGRVTAVAVVHALLPKTWEAPATTAIDKRPVEGRIGVQELGLDGDTQCDRKHHGGPYAAVYAYADEDAAWWSAELGREIAPGLFGENLRTSGIDVTGAEIGEQWQIGDPATGALLEVTSPRIPCRTFADRMGERAWVRRFTDRKTPGAYLRVRRPGPVGAGDQVQVVHRPGHGITIGEVTAVAAPATMRRLLAVADEYHLDLAPGLRRSAVRAGRRD